jgi:hypothetical protein
MSKPRFARKQFAPIIAVAKHLIAAERNAPRRWFGFGGEVPLLNAKAILLSARALRRDEGRRARQRPQNP